jgi:stage II sporulation protein R
MPSFIGNNATRKDVNFMKKAKDLLFTVIMMLGIALTVALMPTEKDAAIYTDTLRLHILASSNSDSDQALKYEIRDKILQKYAKALGQADDPAEAKSDIAELTDDIENDVELWLKEAGYSYGCEVSLGVEWYETREYERFTLPKGYYTSLQIKLGEAEGQNWWCVMYPPLCLDIACEDTPEDDAVVGYTKEEYALITEDGYNVKLKILEVFSDAFSKNS